MTDEAKREVSAEQTAYGEYVKNAIALTRGLQVSHLKWYWDMGALVAGFMAQQASKKFGEKNLDNFAADLKAHMNGVEIGTSTLYCARSINAHYAVDQLDDMVTRGVTVGHLKLLIPLKDEAKTEVTKKLYGPDGKAITIKQLDDVISETAKKSAHVSMAKAEEQVKAQKAKPTPPSAPGDAPAADTEAQVTMSADAAPEAKKPDDGKAGTRGATKQKEFSQPPLKALKALDNAATKMITLTADVLIVVNEAPKVGFDSDKAQKNFREAFNSVRAALRDTIETSTKLLQEMDGLEKDV